MFVVIEASICRDCDLPEPMAKCVGIFASREEAQKCLRDEFDAAWEAHEFPPNCWLSSCQSPEESPESAWIVTKFPEDAELYWHIEEVSAGDRCFQN